jgi:two-component sensor histidine kinase
LADVSVAPFRRFVERFPADSLRSWAAGAVLVVAASVAKLSLDAGAGQPVAPYVTFYPAVVIIALLGGPRVGLGAALTTLLVAWFFFLPDPNSFAIPDRSTAITLAIYFVTSIFLGLAVGFARLGFDAAVASEARRGHTARESVHRIKNLIAVIQAISTKIRREAKSYDDYISIFSQRLSALALAQGVLVRTDWQDVEVKELVESALAPFRPNPGLHISEGPPAKVPARYVGGLCMALYELCTNAMKYGALAEGRGPVNMSWRLEGDDCVLEWFEDTPITEHGESFGTQLIRSALAVDQATKVDYEVADNRVHALFRWRCER